MIHNFIADVRKGGDLLKSFEQTNLLNNLRSITFKSGANCVHELFLQSCLLDDCVLTRNSESCGRGLKLLESGLKAMLFR